VRLAGDTGGQDRFVRLDTTWSTSFPDSLLTLRIGDTLTDALSWSRATRIGGIQFGRNFSLQPYLITAPMPSFLGAATLPSDVELYINGVRQYQGRVPAGPFQLNTIPNINGAGNAQVVMTDALGRATTLNFSLYDTHQLLAKGLSDWSAEFGVVRRDYGVSSFEYGHDPAASGTWRYGVSDHFTAEAHAEATAELSNAGGGGSWLLGQAGVLSGAAARSSYKGHDGSLLELGYDWRNDRFNFAIGGNRTFGDYRDVASLYEAAPPRISAHALASYTTASLGSFSASYLHLRYRDQPATRFANASWFKSIGKRASLNVNLNQDLDRNEDRSVYVGLTIALDDRTSLNAGVSHDQDRSSAALDVSHPVSSQGGFGWRADVRAGAGQSGGQAELDYLGRYGRISSGVSAFGDSRYAYADASGSLVLIGGHPFAARRIDDAFAVVSTDGIANVPVELENRPIGTTDANGVLLVTPLNAYQDNRLSIDPMQLPADVRIDRVRTVAAPADRAGTMVRFGITPIRAASIILVDAAGSVLPLGTRVRVRGRGYEPALVGFDGIVYLDTLDVRSELDIENDNGRCTVSVDYHKQAEGLPQIGPLTCRLEQP
jgi:outer membrane usher protein